MVKLSNILNQPDVQEQFIELSKGSSEAVEFLCNKLGSVKLNKLSTVSSFDYEHYHDDVRQELLMRIVEKRIRWKPSKKKIDNLYLFHHHKYIS